MCTPLGTFSDKYVLAQLCVDYQSEVCEHVIYAVARVRNHPRHFVEYVSEEFRLVQTVSY